MADAKITLSGTDNVSAVLARVRGNLAQTAKSTAQLSSALAFVGVAGVTDAYGYDSGDTIVRYFLANAGTWRGETARQVKAELRRRVGL